MQVTINGEIQQVRQNLTVSELLARLELDPKKVAMERNGEIVPRSTYADVELNDGDAIEIVQFIGGG